MPDVVKRIRVFDHYAIVDCGLPYGYEERVLFYIVDLANLDQPEIVSSYTGSGYIGDWYLNGDRLYLLLYEYTIEVVDLSDPLAPVQVNRFSQPMGDRARSIAGDGDLVYIGTLDNRLGVVSILAPANVIGQANNDQPVRQILLRGKTCYTIGLGLFCVWNFADPKEPAFVNSLAFDALHDSIARSGDYIYSVGVSLDVIDVHNTAHPDAVAQRALSHFSGHAIATEGGWVFTVGFGLGVTLLDASNPVAPDERAFASSNIDANRIRIIDGYAVVGTSRQGAVMLDVRKPAKPAYAGPFAAHDFITDIAVHGDRASITQAEHICCRALHKHALPHAAGDVFRNGVHSPRVRQPALLQRNLALRQTHGTRRAGRHRQYAQITRHGGIMEVISGTACSRSTARWC